MEIDLGLRHLYARPVEGTNYVIFFIKPGYTIEKRLELGQIPRYFA